MESYKLSFCKINKLNDAIFEIIANDSVEIDIAMVRELHIWIMDNFPNPCGMLVNKINQYTYTFEAQREIGNLPQLKAVGVVTYSRVSEVATLLIKRIPRAKRLNLELFTEREEALRWLKNELAV